MRKLLLIFILAIGLLACGEGKVKPKVKRASLSTNTSKFEIVEPKLNLVDTIKSYDNKVYTKYISGSVFQELRESLPDWELPEPIQWENFWFKEYKDDSVLVNYLSGDFNCDSKSDYAFLLQNKNNKQYAVWVLQSKQGKLSVIKLHDLGESEQPLQFGIELVPKGPLFYIDFENDNPKPIKLKCPGIQVSFFETAAVTYYWKSNKFESVTTGD
ncbi:hypothetical protein AHMF7605_12305 [Adhaeribacter arboris]|uniref:Lipoprotein n=1 Tax=Adhaeribacter arboris TaxID=2072846 RepID=A0A2T2YFG4_9BACT|nr:hypothetical protein [Adhaeribacter arboris]PSR54250.1 hypothetical protein AHMF7605_12305 [Adhaeribacter arboris]